LLSACASYHADPLSDVSSLLAPPIAGVLEEKASMIERPWLRPVSIDLSQPLSLDAVSALAVANNPDLEAQRQRAGVAEAQAFAAGLLPDPTISLGANKVVSGPDTMLDLASALGLDINALRTRAVTRQQALASARQVRLDLAWSEWQAAGQARIQAVRILELEQAVAVARTSLEATSALYADTRKAAARGDVSGDRLQSARAGAFDLADRLRTSETDLASAREELARLLGVPPDTRLVIADPGLPPATGSTAALFALAQARRSDLAALRAGYASQEASVRKAVLDQFPNLSLTLNANRDSAGNALIGPAVDFTLPLWNRNRGGIAVERATREALKAEYEARAFQTRAEIGAAVAGLRLARQQRARIEADLPEVRRFAQASGKAAARGDLSRETAIVAAQALRDRQLQLIQNTQDIFEQTIALELLTGTPMEIWDEASVK
jgi:outer membrane protein, heavy metal efflux system